MAAESEGTEGKEPSFWKKILSALLYGVSSFLITAVNKIVLTSYKFPSYQVLGIGQMVATVVVLFTGKQLGIVSIPDLQRSTIRKIFPLPVFYLGNLIFGLGGTQSVSLPMFTALRRLTVLMTLFAQYFINGIKVSVKEQIAVYAMVGGAMLAAIYDLGFQPHGYIMILMNDFCTASNNVYIKKRADTKDMGPNGVMFYNSLFMISPLCFIAWYTGEFDKIMEYDKWRDIGFLLHFFMSCIMGFVLTLGVFLCTTMNSALTSTVVGSLKNIFITYIGMFIGGDYVFSLLNFVGINISISGSLFYTYTVFFSKMGKRGESSKADAKEMQEAEKLLQSTTNTVEEAKEVKVEVAGYHGRVPAKLSLAKP